MFTLIVFVINILKFSVGNTLYPGNNTNLIPCSNFPKIDDGYVKIIKADFTNILHETAHIECNTGYDLIGPPKILCIDGKWESLISIKHPQCIARCKPPFPIRNGIFAIDDVKDENNLYKKGALATFKCIDGFTLSPPDSRYRVCEKGIWTGANATCAPVVKITNCKPPKQIKNGYFVHEKQKQDSEIVYVIGQRILYSCYNGFSLRGDITQRCIEDGTWSPKIPPTCFNDASEAVLHCPLAPTYLHATTTVVSGYQTESTANAGTEVEIRCIPKYRNNESPCAPSIMRCISGKWMGIPPNCVYVKDCSCPPKVSHGNPFILAPNQFDIDRPCKYPFNTQISYQCLPGYELEGNINLTCMSGGCWVPFDPPVCKSKEFRHYYLEPNGDEPIFYSLVTGVGVLILLVIACLAILFRRSKPLSRAVAIPPPVPRADLADHASLLHPPDRLALIAFADGMQVGQSGLPTYEEATRDRSLGFASRLQRPPWPSLMGRRARNSPNPDILFTRQGSFASHSASTRSGGDSMGSTDTMAVSENSTTVTLDTASSHSGSQPASCRAHCGSLASFDTSSVLNTEGVPLLEESELEEMQCGDTVSLAMENRSMCDNSSYKLSTASDIA